MIAYNPDQTLAARIRIYLANRRNRALRRAVAAARRIA